MIEQPSGQNQELTVENVKSPEEIAEELALELVKRDAESAESWLEAQQWNETWLLIDILYDSQRQFATFEGGNTQKAAVNRFILCQHVNTIHPAMVEGLFYDNEYFTAEPRPGTDSETVRARVAVISMQLDEMEFRNEVDLGIFQDVLHGTGIWKWGLRWIEEDVYEYQRQGEPISTTSGVGEVIVIQTVDSMTYKEVCTKKMVLKPFFENREIREVLVDPKLKVPDIRKARWVIDKYYLTLEELLELRKDPNYDMPDEDTIRGWLATPKEMPAQLGNLDPQPGVPSTAGQGQPDWIDSSADPYEDCLMVLERWDGNKVITTLNNKKVIQNRPNPYGVVPFYSCNFYDRIRSFHGIGVGKMVGTDQRLQQGLENAGLALLQLLLDPPFAINEEAYTPTQNVRFRKGGFVKVKGDVRAAIAPLEMPRLPIGEIFTFLQNSQAKAEAADGSDSMLMGGSSSGAGKMSTKSPGAVANIGGATAARLQGPVDRFVNRVFLPWIYQLDELNRRFIMTTPEGIQQIQTILKDELGDKYVFQPDKFLNGRVEFDCLAGAQLAAKKTMEQSMPIITQIFDNPQINQQVVQYEGESISIKEILLMWLQSTGWKNRKSLFKKVSAQQQQAASQNSPAAAKAAADAQLLQLKQAGDKDLQDQKSADGITRDAIKKSLEEGETGVLRKDYENSNSELGG